MAEILIINGSARLNGDTHQFLNRLMQGMTCQQINLAEHHILPYTYEGVYPSDDQFHVVAREILYHSHLIFATPVYWYSMSGKMKNLFDRITDWTTINPEIGRNLKGKTVKLVAVGTDGDLPDGFTNPFYLTANYLEMLYQGHIYHNVNIEQTDEELESIRKSFFTLK